MRHGNVLEPMVYCDLRSSLFGDVEGLRRHLTKTWSCAQCMSASPVPMFVDTLFVAKHLDAGPVKST